MKIMELSTIVYIWWSLLLRFFPLELKFGSLNTNNKLETNCKECFFFLNWTLIIINFVSFYKRLMFERNWKMFHTSHPR